MLRRVMQILALVMVLAVLAACAAPVAPAGEQAGAAQPAAGQPGEKKTLDLWFNSDDLFNQYIEKVIADFEAANPDVDIVYSPYPNEAYKTTLQVAIGSDDPPDMFFNWAGDDTGRYVREGHLVDLTPYAEQYKWGDQHFAGGAQCLHRGRQAVRACPTARKSSTSTTTKISSTRWGSPCPPLSTSCWTPAARFARQA